MRVVVVTTSFPRDEDDPSGHFVRSAARAIAASGAEVHVIAPGGTLFDSPKKQGDLIIQRAGGGDLFAWPGAVARAKEAPWRVLGGAAFIAGARVRLARIGRCDRAIAHWIVPSAFPILTSTIAPLEVHAHGADVRILTGLPSLLRSRIVASLLDRSAHIVFAARSLLHALVASLPSPLDDRLLASAHVEPPPIDVPDVADLAAAHRRSLDLAPGERLAVTVCRLIPSKRVELAIEAAREAGVRLVIVGDGPAREALKARASDANARVVFTGALPRREALAWIAAADVLVHPSAVEAAPTVVREARVLGTPVVACNAGDVEDWSETDRQIVVVAGDVPLLAGAVRALAFSRS